MPTSSRLTYGMLIECRDLHAFGQQLRYLPRDDRRARAAAPCRQQVAGIDGVRRISLWRGNAGSTAGSADHAIRAPCSAARRLVLASYIFPVLASSGVTLAHGGETGRVSVPAMVG